MICVVRFYNNLLVDIFSINIILTVSVYAVYALTGLSYCVDFCNYFFYGHSCCVNSEGFVLSVTVVVSDSYAAADKCRVFF